MPYAENPETGERMVLNGSAWEPVKQAVNPQTQETMDYFGDKWVPSAKKINPTVMGAPAGGPPPTPKDGPEPATREITPADRLAMLQDIQRAAGMTQDVAGPIGAVGKFLAGGGESPLPQQVPQQEMQPQCPGGF